MVTIHDPSFYAAILLSTQRLCIKPCGILVPKGSNLKRSQNHFIHICNGVQWYLPLKNDMDIPIMISTKIWKPHTPRGMILLKVLLFHYW